MKIVHVSDLHFDKDFKRNNIIKFERLLKFLNKTNIDHLVITGDISHGRRKEDYLILKDLLRENNFLHTDKTSLVIGNHDIFGGVITAEDVIDFPNKCKETVYQDEIDDFFYIFSELFDSAIFPGGKKNFPYLKFVKEVLFIGINSNAKYSFVKNLFASNGKVSKTQFNDLQQLLQNPVFELKKKIVLIHHHFSKFQQNLMDKKNPLWNKLEKTTMKLRGKKKLLELFKSHNVEMVLHGHVHHMNEYMREGIKFMNAGASIDNYHENKIQFNLIKITTKNFVSSVESFENNFCEIPIAETI